PWRVEAAEADLPRGAKAVTDAVFADAEPTQENAYKLKLAERTLSAALNQARA
ncbi:xanthine dehydrogenase family protein subunit M, partial [Methylobacterium sp. WL122]